jgi:mannosyltransferase OCH1-like enzyme
MNKIPKIIHYCWFGRNELPELAIKCINSWKTHLPEYKLVLWNEENFDWQINDYVKEAYEQGKFAFVSDYVRLHALYHFGGVYMDTDVEVISPIDKFLLHRAFAGAESETQCGTGLMAAEQKHPWVKLLLNEYNMKSFIMKNGKMDTTANTALITKKTIEHYNWNPNIQYQKLSDDLHIYPIDFFCAKDWRTGKVNITNQTFAIHHFSGSWFTKDEKKRLKRKRKIIKIITAIIGQRAFGNFINIKNRILIKK